MRDTNLGNEPEPVSKYLESFSVTEPFDTEVERLNVQALGMSINGLDHGRDSYDYELIDGMEGSAAAYQTPEDFTSVLMFEAGWGYFCAQTPRDIGKIENWFEQNFSEYRDEAINILDYDA